MLSTNHIAIGKSEQTRCTMIGIEYEDVVIRAT